jgi:hyaluronoglucosaminidase
MTSPFAVRGVIEGFYGNPWTHEQRLECVRFIGARGMNTFVYGPKDDPLVRRSWRVPYADDALRRISELVVAGADAGVEIVYAISPGLSIRYSSERDGETLLGKLEQVAALGFSSTTSRPSSPTRMTGPRSATSPRPMPRWPARSRPVWGPSGT